MHMQEKRTQRIPCDKQWGDAYIAPSVVGHF